MKSIVYFLLVACTTTSNAFFVPNRSSAYQATLSEEINEPPDILPYMINHADDNAGDKNGNAQDSVESRKVIDGVELVVRKFKNSFNSEMNGLADDASHLFERYVKLSFQSTAGTSHEVFFGEIAARINAHKGTSIRYAPLDEITVDLSVNQTEPDAIIQNDYVLEMNPKAIAVIVELTYFSKQCRCIYGGRSSITVFNNTGISLAEKTYSNKSPYWAVVNSDLTYVGISWETIWTGFGGRPTDVRGVSLVSLESGSEVYSDSLTLNEDYLTSMTLVSKEELFVYKKRRLGKNFTTIGEEHFIISPERNLVYSKYLSNTELMKLADDARKENRWIDIVYGFPSRVIK